MRRNSKVAGKFVWAAVAVTLLGGCGQGESGEAAAVQSESVVQDTAQAESTEAAAEQAAEAKPVAEAILKVKEEGDVEAMCKALQVVVDEKRSEMENYLPDQFEIVDKSSVKSKGNYVYLVISGQADAILQIIEKAI